MEADRNYMDYIAKGAEGGGDSDTPARGAIIGPLSRADEKLMRYVEYGTAAISASGSTTFTPSLNLRPDFWVIKLAPKDALLYPITIQEANSSQALALNVFNGQSQRIVLPARAEGLTVSSSAGVGAVIAVIIAAVWGYAPGDVL